MCLYIATATPIKVGSSRDGLTVVRMEDADRPNALGSLRYAYVYEISTTDGCACPLGIMVRNVPEGSTLEQDEDDVRFRHTLLDLLAGLIAQGPVDLYPCWEGEEQIRPDAHCEATLSDLEADWALLRERRLTHLAA